MSVVTSGSTRRMTEPPGPPLPPSGPPNGLNFSRCTDATPLPPRPALMCSVTRSTKVGTAMGGTSRNDEGRPETGTPFEVSQRMTASSLTRDDVDDAATAPGAELDGTADEREQGVVTAPAD